MMEWVCPSCGRVPSSITDKTQCFICPECNTFITRQMLEKLPRAQRGGFTRLTRKSPEFILKGTGWPGKEIKKEVEDE